MDGLTLLAEGRTAGLTVKSDGDRLVVRGPGRLADLAQRLAAHKLDVLAALAVEAAGATPGTGAGSEGGLATGDSASACTPLKATDGITGQADGTGDVPPPPPCPRCGWSWPWWNVLDEVRCMRCDPPSDAALRFIEAAARARVKETAKVKP